MERSVVLKRLAGAGGTVLAVVLMTAIVVVGRPASIWKYVVDVNPLLLIGAGAAATLANVLRGFKLIILIPSGSLSAVRAWCIAALAQVAALFLPARTGELALPFLLVRQTKVDTAEAFGLLIGVRILDLAALAVWGAAGIIGVWGFGQSAALWTAVLLLMLSLVLPVLIVLVDRAVPGISIPSMQRLLEIVHRVAVALEELGKMRLRLLLAFGLSLATWAMIWLSTVLLLRAMGLTWPVPQIILGASIAALASVIPFALPGGFGPIQAGWAAVFGLLGFDLARASAAGVAVHLWTLIFCALNGLAAWPILISRPREGDGPS